MIALELSSATYFHALCVEETVQPKRFCEEIQKKKREKERTRTDERR